MIKIFGDMEVTNYDDFIDRIVARANKSGELPLGGFKLPSIAGAAFKKLPQDKKNWILIKAVAKSKNELCHRASYMLENVMGPTTICDAGIKPEGGNRLVCYVTLSQYDAESLMEMLIKPYYTEEAGERAIGKHYSGSYDFESVKEFVKNQNAVRSEQCIVKLLRAVKCVMMRQMEAESATRNITIEVHDLKFTCKSTAMQRAID